ncbi:hypothetical protein LC092_05485 [Stappia stellulata]|uniref:hypothetical protein n=1 Tax=Stappia stellulata TaxID=71235 RepID=UPI001CD5D02C|nr:hypothetical protein [Stappia stellulata]MCA1241880.1 hypothetical protein [Stappia stellulata]
MDANLSWIVGSAMALVVMIGGIIARDRQLTRMVQDGDEKSTRMIQDGDEKLHDRINRVREDMVRRTDLDDHLQRVDKTLESLRHDIREQGKETTRRFDALLAAITKPP